MYFVYILHSTKLSRYYIGQTNNINRRLKYHNSGLGNYTSKGVPWILRWYTEKSTRSEAIILEKKLKNLSQKRLQAFKKVNLIVSYDDEFTREYLKSYQIDELVGFNRIEDWSGISNEVFLPGYIEKPFPPNEYFNMMMEYTKPGYIIYLDDDDKFSSPDSLSKIISRISNERQMLLWRVQFPGYLIPDNQHFGQTPVCCQIASSGFTFHSSYIKHAQWDGYNYSDFRTALSLFLHIPQKGFINEVITALQSITGSGLINNLPIQNRIENEI